MRKLTLAIIVAIAAFLLVISVMFIPLANVYQLWNFPTTGSVYNSPLTNNGSLYVNSYYLQRTEGAFYCLNASNGNQTWTIGFNRDLPFPPTVSDNYVYFGTESGNLYCLNLHTSIQIWNFSTGTYITNPVLRGGYIYVGSGSNFYALNSANGAIVWNQTIGVLNSALGSLFGKDGYPIIREGVIYLAFGDYSDSSNPFNGIIALNALTGAKHWENVIPEHVDVASLAISSGRAILGAYSINNQGAGNMSYTGYVYAFNAATGNKEWSQTIGTYKWDAASAISIIADKSIIVGYGNKISALSPSNGNKVWSFVNNGLVGSIELAKPFIYFTLGANLYCLDANNGIRIWSFNVEGSKASGPYVAHGQVYVGSVGDQYFAPSIYNTVYALNSYTGIQTWRHTVEGNPDSFAYAKGVLYVGTTYQTTGNPDNEGNGSVYALQSGSLITLFLETAAVFITVIIVLVIVIRRIVLKANRKPQR